MTGRLWAHEAFDLPCPPDVVTSGKESAERCPVRQRELATFFQEERRSSTPHGKETRPAWSACWRS